MCILVVIKKGQKLSDEQIRNCIINNPDGTGIGYYIGNKQIIRKIGKAPIYLMISCAKYWLKKAYNEATTPIIFHSRIATGSVKINIMHNHYQCVIMKYY